MFIGFEGPGDRQRAAGCDIIRNDFLFGMVFQFRVFRLGVLKVLNKMAGLDADFNPPAPEHPWQLPPVQIPFFLPAIVFFRSHNGNLYLPVWLSCQIVISCA